MALAGTQLEQLSRALRSAFRKRSRLEELLAYGLGRQLNDYVGEGGLEEVVFQLLQRAESEGWTGDLVRAALSSNPRNPNLAQFYREWWLPLAAPSRVDLERIVRPGIPYLEIGPWVEKLRAIGRQVCRISVPGDGWKHCGTGFLVGPSLLMTNHHVVTRLIDGSTDARQAEFLFDYCRLPDGTTLNPGHPLPLAGARRQEWLVADSPAKGGLDYAVLRLEGAPGEERGWVEILPDLPPVTTGSPILIVQHPRSEPLKLAIDTDGILEFNPTNPFVRYRTNTEPGSSGAPCFTVAWEFLALHHAGGDGEPAEFNEGVLANSIASHLRDSGVEEAIGTPH